MSEHTSTPDQPELSPADAIEPEPGVAGRPGIVIWFMRLVALVAVVAAVYLSAVTVTRGNVAGCAAGGLFDCDRVLESRWSTWLGMPVSVFGSLNYIIALLALCLVGPRRTVQSTAGPWSVLVLSTTLAAGAGTWFVLLQLFKLEQLCAYCLLVHGCGFVLFLFTWWQVISQRRLRLSLPGSAARVLAVRMAFVACLAVAGVVVGQVLVKPASYREYSLEDEPAFADNAPAGSWRDSLEVATDDLDTVDAQWAAEQGLPPIEDDDESKDDSSQSDMPASDVLANLPTDTDQFQPALDREITLYGGRAKFRLDKVPLVGPANAKHVIAMLFDYTCPACRKMHGFMTRAVPRYKGALAVAMLPLPLDSDCNHTVKHTNAQHFDACELAQMAVAVWDASPTRFAEYDQILTAHETPPGLATARSQAMLLVGQRNLEAAMKNDAFQKLINENIKIHERFRRKKIPIIVLKHHVLMGTKDTADELFKFLEDNLNLVPRSGTTTKHRTGR